MKEFIIRLKEVLGVVIGMSWVVLVLMMIGEEPTTDYGTTSNEVTFMGYFIFFYVILAPFIFIYLLPKEETK